MVVFTIPGEPQGKARGRTFIHKHTGRPTTMTPEKTVNYEALIKLQAGQSTKEFYQDQELFMRLTAYYSIPKSASKKKAELMRNIEIRPTKKPDIDNIIKVVCDALNGVVYKDDTQIVSISAQKFYENVPRVEVCIFTKEEVRKGKAREAGIKEVKL